MGVLEHNYPDPSLASLAASPNQASGRHVQILFDSDAQAFWFKKASVASWLRSPQALQATGTRRRQHGGGC